MMDYSVVEVIDGRRKRLCVCVKETLALEL
jgi:hypothetical protein